MMVELNLPVAPLKLSKSGEAIHVICLLRKKKIRLTPEEWVRQHVIHFVTAFRNYPEGLIKIEHGINIHALFRRCDLVLYDRKANSRIIVECKAPNISVSGLTFDQAAHYNQHLDADYLFLTNGIEHKIFKIDRDGKQLCQLKDLPYFEEL